MCHDWIGDSDWQRRTRRGRGEGNGDVSLAGPDSALVPVAGGEALPDQVRLPRVLVVPEIACGVDYRSEQGARLHDAEIFQNRQDNRRVVIIVPAILERGDESRPMDIGVFQSG